MGGSQRVGLGWGARAPGEKPETRAGMTMRGPQVVQRCETRSDNDLSLSNTVVINLWENVAVCIIISTPGASSEDCRTGLN